MSNAAVATGPVVEKRRGGGMTATALLAPATIFVAICLLAPLAFLFRYSLNDFVATKKMMVEAVTIANYVKFFTDPYYTAILARRCASPSWSPPPACCWASRWPM